MPEQLWFTEFLNHHFGAMTTALLRHLGIQPVYPNAPINNTIAMELLVIFILLAFFAIVRASLSVEKPGGLQHTVEAVHEFVPDQPHGVIGRRYANMYGGDMVTASFFSLVPVLVPVAFLGLHLFVSLVQTFIFVMLTLVYLGMAVSEEH